MVISGASLAVEREDPRAPSQDAWDRMSEAQQAQAICALPASVPLGLYPPEGDRHRFAKESIRETLDRFFRHTGRRVYVASELVVYYPDEPRFVPDILAVVDVGSHERDSWVVSAEGKGLDVVIEVHYRGDPKKDFVRNPKRFARLGIPEYFVFDRRALTVQGWRLGDGPEARYEPLLPQAGRVGSRLLGLELVIEGERLRFFHGTAPLLDGEETAARLEHLVDELVASREEAQQARDEERRERERAERDLAEAKAEIERLRRQSLKGSGL